MKRRIYKKSKLILFILLTLSLLCTFTFFRNLKATEEKYKNAMLIKAKENFSTAFDKFTYPLQGISSAIHMASFKFTYQDFKNSSESRGFYKNFPGALGFGFIRKVKTTELKAYEKDQKKLRPDFQLHRLDTENSSEYDFVIETIEPIEKNRQAVGLIVSSETHRREAAFKAMNEGTATVTKPIHLVQVEKSEPGFLLYLPIYRSSVVPTTLEERRSNLVGLAYAPVLASAIIQHIENQSSQLKIISLEQIIENNNTVKFYTNKLFNQITDQNTVMTTQFKAAGRIWNSQFIYSADQYWSPLLKSFITLILFISVSFAVYFYFKKSEEKEFQNENLLIESQKQIAIATIKLEEQKHMLQKMIDNVPALISYWDKNLVNLIANQTYYKYYGHAPGKINGMHITEVLGPIYHLNKIYIENVMKGIPQVFERDIPTPEGVKSTISQYLPEIQNGEVVGFFALITDVTEVKSMQKLIDEQRQFAIQSEKMIALGEMAAGLAHEINNPLAIINGSIQLLERFKNDPDKYANKTEQILNATKRISKIIKGLRKFSHSSENESLKLHSLAKIVDEALVLIVGSSRNRGVPIKTEIDTSLIVFVNEIEVEQVLINLIGNAADAIQDFDEKWINVKAFKNENKIIMQVIDSGKGISKEIENKLFQPFFTTKRVGEGTGLGLSISKGLIESNGGNLSINRKLTNTCFEIVLPTSNAQEESQKKSA